MVFILTNHLGNYVRPLKCLNDQGGTSNNPQGYSTLCQFPISFSNDYSYIIVPTPSIASSNRQYNLDVGVLWDYKKANSCLLRCTVETGPSAFYIAVGK